MYQNHKVILKILTIQDADSYADLYLDRKQYASMEEDSFLPGETRTEFTKRIISLCEYIFTIRAVDNPDLIIGDCALHHWDKEKREIEIGGTLLKEYQAKGFMQAAFDLLFKIALEQLKAKNVIARSKPNNIRAIKFAEKCGFKVSAIDDTQIIFKMEL